MSPELTQSCNPSNSGEASVLADSSGKESAVSGSVANEEEGEVWESQYMKKERNRTSSCDGCESQKVDDESIEMMKDSSDETFVQHELSEEMQEDDTMEGNQEGEKIASSDEDDNSKEVGIFKEESETLERSHDTFTH